jgi:protein tyrosine phosphatase (PTP) superfamily phosphohydrolase (DUF442 family)
MAEAVPIPDPQDVFMWQRMDRRLTTSGQPTEEQLLDLRALGVTHIVNLALHSHERALADEAASVAALGITYVHIPVDFENPTEADFQRFCEVMRELKTETIHVHCIANFRVSAFLYRYRREEQGVPDPQARAAMERIGRVACGRNSSAMKRLSDCPIAMLDGT